MRADNRKRSLPSMVRVSVGLISLVIAVSVLRFCIHLIVATWLVFPAPVLNPSSPEVNAPVALLERARRHARGEAHYSFMLAQVHLQQMRAQWLRPEGLSLGAKAADDANRALELLPDNPFYHRLAGSVAIDLARHPATPEAEARQICESAIVHMENALRRSPSSPLLHQQVGLELLKAWHLLDASGKDLARQALHLAASWEGGRLETSLAAIWARAPRQETLDLLATVTPDAAEARDALGRFLADEAVRFSSSDERLSRDLGSRSFRAHRSAMDLADLDLAYVERWVLAYERLLPGEPEQFLAAAQELVAELPQRAETHLVLARALAGAGRPEEARSSVAHAVSLSVAPLRERTGSSTGDGPTALETSVARLSWELDQARQLSRQDQHLRRDAEVYGRALRYEADLLFDNGSYELSLQRYRRLAALEAGDPYPAMQMGRVLDALGQTDEALERYRAAVRVAPRSATARSALARAYLERYEYLEAIREWRVLASRNPRAMAPRMEIARAYREMGLLEEAMRSYSDALELDPGNAALRREMEAVVGRLQGSERRRD